MSFFPRVMDAYPQRHDAENKLPGEALRWAIIRLDEARRHLMEAGVKDEALEVMRLRARVTRRRIRILNERMENAVRSEDF